jgi:tetratricopeptide (TPR) repeat protein
MLKLDALIALGRRSEAIAVHEEALKLTSSSADAFDALAFFARQLDRHALSNDLYRRAVELAPQDPQFWYNLATSERSLGRLVAAADACDRALAINPSLRAALLLRTEVSRATSAANHVDELTALIAATGEEADAVFLLFALGKEFHELGEYDRAFASFSRGAAMRRLNLRYDVRQDERKLKRIEEVFSEPTPPPLDRRVGRHIFIVGMPRSGTTLTERILGGLAGVRSNNETDNFSTALLRCAPPEGGDVFARAAGADFAAVAREYETLAVSDGFTGKVIEKLPFNYLYIGAILRAFPKSPVLWVKRDPLDTCFAMYRTLFGTAYPFSYDFEELARYYVAYDSLMRHWERLFPTRITSVDYEAIVRMPGIVAPHLAERCGLVWTPRALDLTLNKSASLTASAAQVRGQIYSSSSGMWRNYAEHLEPLRQGLLKRGVALAGS